MPPRRKAAAKKQTKKSNPLEDAVFAITGTLSDTRANITKKINLLGGNVASSVTKAVTHVLCSQAEYAGKTTKVLKAESMGLPIVSEDFLEACEKAGTIVAPDDYLLSNVATTASTSAAGSPGQGARAGAGPEVDPKSNLATQGRLYSDDEYGIYHAQLVQQDRAKNMDKYYINQVIVSNNGDQFWAFQRWGRTGTSGQQKSEGPLASAEEAVEIFLKKFKEKTGNEYAKGGAGFVQKKGKYNLVQQTYTNSDSSRFIWQYYLDAPLDGKAQGWHNYDEEASEYVEDMFGLYLDNSWLEVRYVKSGAWTYKVDYPAMQQTNVEHVNHTVRNIRRFDRVANKPAEVVQPTTGQLADEEDEDDDDYQPSANDDDGDGSDSDGDSHDSQQPPTKKQKTSSSGTAAPPLDKLIPFHIASDCVVLIDGEDIYDATLNQTNVNANNNKFYLIQVVQSTSSPNNFYLWNRWGRVGVSGQNSLRGPVDKDSVIADFKKKFYDKTRNKWEDRNDFKPIAGKYTYLEMKYDDEEEAGNSGGGSGVTGSVPQSTLPADVQRLISIICDKDMMKEQMMSIGYDAQKLPLGKLSDNTIRKGYAVLERVMKTLKGDSDEKIDQLSSEFYTYIPHNFGFARIQSFQLDTLEKVKEKMALLDSLSQIEAASAVLSNADSGENPVDSQYKRLKCSMETLPANSQEYQTIASYLNKTFEGSASSRPQIQQVFKISREGEDQRFKDFQSVHNRRLLWHGSRLTNWAGILSQGLRVAPPEAPVSGYNFGKGLYFADMFSKSSSYCYYQSHLPCALLALAEVSLGDMNELVDADYNANNLPPGKMSTKALGKRFPDPKGDVVMTDGVIVPAGKATQTPKANQRWFSYNEFIVYKEAQARLRYLVQVKW